MDDKTDHDKELKMVLDKIQSGDTQSYSLIIDRFQKQIYLYCYYLLRNQQEAEDATQEIFIKGLENIARFTYNASLSAWLYRIAKNHCTDQIKKKNKELQFLKGYQVDQQDQEHIHKYTEYILECLDQLNLEERQILLLRSLEEYSYEEIAFIMDLKPMNIRKKYERLRKKLIQEKKKGGRIYEHSYRTGR